MGFSTGGSSRGLLDADVAIANAAAAVDVLLLVIFQYHLEIFYRLRAENFTNEMSKMLSTFL